MRKIYIIVFNGLESGFAWMYMIRFFFKLNIFSIFWSTGLCPVFYLFRYSSCFWGQYGSVPDQASSRVMFYISFMGDLFSKYNAMCTASTCSVFPYILACLWPSM